MSNSGLLTFLGVLTVSTQDGRRPVAVALSGASELHHLVDAELDLTADSVRDWLWSAGINPDNAANALPANALIHDILAPAVGTRTLVLHHRDTDLDFVSELAVAVRENGGYTTISGIELIGEMESDQNAEAARRADALRSRYEAAIAIAEKEPLIHKISGSVDAEGALTSITISGVFANQKWDVKDENEALFVLANVSHMGPLAAFAFEPGPAQRALKKLADESGLLEGSVA
jgi:hypothetical protein